MLYRAVLANTFGQRCRKPLQSAYVRLFGLLLAGSILGILAAQQLPSVPVIFSGGLHILATIVVITQTCGLAALLVMQNVLQPVSDTTARLLYALPLYRRQFWVALLLPNAIILLVTSALLLPSLMTLLHDNVHPLVLPAAALLGACSAQLILISAQSHRLAPLTLSVAITCTDFVLLSRMNRPEGNLIAALALCLLFTAICYFGFRTLARPPVFSVRKSLYAVGRSFPRNWWFIKKVARAEITQLGCLSGLIICGGLAFTLRLHYGPAIYALPASLLAAAAVADIRSLSRPHCSVEIMLRGVGHFFRSELVAGGILGFTVAAPFLIVVLPTGISNELVTLSYILLGSGVGFFASTVIAPGQRDISGQLLATLLCLGIMLALAVLAPTGLAPILQLAYGCSVAITLILSAAAIEYLRNPFTWRKQ